MQEEWRPVPVPLFADLYLVSNLGRIKRTAPTAATRCREGVLKPRPNKRKYPYPVVTLWCKNRPKNYRVNRLVALTFLGPPPPGKPFALHRDDDPMNCCVGNLFWGSAQDNSSDMVAKGRHRNGGRFTAKLSLEAYAEVRASYWNGVQQKALAERYGVSQASISRIVKLR